tara:strand:- start:579 stop:1502 length:924 start_codon:yes stop_codon:yes gene_type:complete
MIGIEAIGSYIPPHRELNADKKEQFGITDAFLEAKVGVLRRARKGDDEETSDLCCRAFESLAAKIEIQSSDIDCLIVCTQNPDGHGLPHTSAVVQGKLGCSNRVAAFDISLGCSGYVYGLSVITSFMQANGLKQGVLFTADPYSKIIDPTDKSTSLLFGDAATATLISTTPKLTTNQTRFGTRGQEGGALARADESLFMNGRAVFNFTVTAVPPQVQEVLQAAGYQLTDIDLFVFHQGSKFIVDQLTQRLKLPVEKVPTNLSDIGNTVSSSIPLLLEDYLPAAKIQRVLISGFGVGLSWASAVLERT